MMKAAQVRAWRCNADFCRNLRYMPPPLGAGLRLKMNRPNALPRFTVIYDSFAIMEYANELSGGRLLPADLKARAHARSLAAWQHAGLSGLCPRLSFESSFYPDRRSMSDDEIAESGRIFDVWEQELSQSNGPYLLGELSLADLCFVPSVLRLTSHMLSLDRWPLGLAWTRALLGRPAVKDWLAEANTLPPVRLDGYRDQRV
jgi:glutathione S-transferase